jgi:hypothetical protein
MQLQAAQGLKFVTGFYWDRDDESRAWSKRFFDKQGRMPTMARASVYSAVRHYLASIKAAGTDEAKAVMAKMRELPVNDFYVKNGHVREDGTPAARHAVCAGEDARGTKGTMGLLQASSVLFRPTRPFDRLPKAVVPSSRIDKTHQLSVTGRLKVSCRRNICAIARF